jgi:hypothetical protein
LKHGILICFREFMCRVAALDPGVVRRMSIYWPASNKLGIIAEGALVREVRRYDADFAANILNFVEGLGIAPISLWTSSISKLGFRILNLTWAHLVQDYVRACFCQGDCHGQPNFLSTTRDECCLAPKENSFMTGSMLSPPSDS